MNVLNSVNSVTATTNDNTLDTDSILQAWNAMSVSFTIKNTGDTNSLSYEVIGGHTSDLSDGVVVQASDNVAAGAVGSYAVSTAPFTFYGIKIVSTSAGNHTTSSILGRAKG